MNGFFTVHGVLEALLRRGGKRRDRGAGRGASRPLHFRSLRQEPLEDRTLLSVAAVFQPVTAIFDPSVPAILRPIAPIVVEPIAPTIIQPKAPAIVEPIAPAVLQPSDTATYYHVLTNLATSSSNRTASAIPSLGSATPAATSTVYYAPSQI